MKKGKNRFSGFVIALLLVALIAGAMVAGYKFTTLTNKEADEKFKEVARQANETAEEKLGIDVSSLLENGSGKDFEYKQQNTRTYNGKKLYESYGYIFNDSGEVLEDFKKDVEYGLDMEFDVDRKYGVFVIDNCSYLVNAELEVTMITDKCTSAQICYEGTYVCLECNTGIYLYNIETGEFIGVDRNGYDPVVSPDGSTVAYYRWNRISSNGTELVVSRPDREDEVIGSLSGYIIVRAVSNDGNTVYYENNDINGEKSLYCIHNGKKKKIKKRWYGNCYFDRDCKTMLFTDSDSTYFFDSETGKTKRIIKDDSAYAVNIFAPSCFYSSVYKDNTIIDTDCFANAVIIDTANGVYCLEGYVPKAVMLADSRYGSRSAMTEDGPACVYQSSSDSKLVKAVYRNGSMEYTDLLMGIRVYTSYIVNDELTKVWCTKLRSNTSIDYEQSVAEFTDDGQEQEIASFEYTSIDELIWDDIFDRIYYTANKNLYRFNTDGSEGDVILSQCSYYDYIRYQERPIELSDSKGNEYIIINDRAYKK